MTNKEKFKEVFGKELAESLDFDTSCSRISQIVALRSMYIKGVDNITEWLNADYDGEALENQKTGHWINVDYGYYECSECGRIEMCNPNYCQDCGAKMKGEENE